MAAGFLTRERDHKSHTKMAAAPHMQAKQAI